MLRHRAKSSVLITGMLSLFASINVFAATTIVDVQGQPMIITAVPAPKEVIEVPAGYVNCFKVPAGWNILAYGLQNIKYANTRHQTAVLLRVWHGLTVTGLVRKPSREQSQPRQIAQTGNGSLVTGLNRWKYTKEIKSNWGYLVRVTGQPHVCLQNRCMLHAAI